jgi:hypothetical protein
MREALFVLAVLILLASAPVVAETSIQLAEEFPLRGQETTVTVVDDGGADLAGSGVTATYRPNSETASTETVGTLDSAGRIAWTPTDAGIVTLAVHPAPGEGEADATLATTDLSVRYGGFPPAGLAIMVIAGLLLFGGAGLGMALLLSGPDLPVDEPPST